jgi:hypothetical protein
MPLLTYELSAAITLCGPRYPSVRFDENKEINLTNFLPSYLQEEQIAEVTDLFQDFLNEMYAEYIYTTSALDIEVSARTKLSVLEKINRIAEFHDPEYIDTEYIQFFANYLGYNVDITRGELGILENEDSEDLCVIEDVKRYLSFVVSNLPDWYKIKTTNDAIKIMLYSFGLVGNLVERYTSDYRTDNGRNWFNFRTDSQSLFEIPSGYYPTPHFLIRVNLDTSPVDFSSNENTRFNVFNSVESIRPVNTVFDGAMGTTTSSFTLFQRVYFQEKFYIYIT